MEIVPFLIVFFIGYFVGKKISLREKAQGLLNKILGKK
jgi:predicted permease